MLKYYILSSVHLVTDFAPGSILIIMTHMKTLLNLSYFQTTLIYLMIEVTSSFLQPILGYISDKGYKVWIIPASTVLSITALSSLGFIDNYKLLLFVVFLSGIGVAAFHPYASRLVFQLSRGGNQAQAMSIFSLGGTLGVAFAPVLMSFFIGLSGLKGTIYFLIPAILVIPAAGYYLFKIDGKYVLEDPFKKSAKKGNPEDEKKRVNSIIILLLFVIVRSWLSAGILNFIPLYFIDYLGKAGFFGSRLLTLFLTAGAVGTVIAGRLGDKIGMLKILTGFITLTIPFTYLIFNTSSFITNIAAVLTGFVLMSTFGITVILGQRVMPGNAGLAAGLMTGFGSGLGALGATGLGYIADSFSIIYSIRVILMLPVAALVLLVLLNLNRDKILNN
ncbi:MULTISPECIES: MFS transporter [unclassified Halanaerobium]|uniref:MFS transporter n=1 Tax=unclassified Halanaerobium TaxID=2641197 RepID=UPI000DF13608|nr:MULTISPECIES: MFS transporter [unclassified Halanaerobium]RCW46354.1 FSR family fosmidomycin resistance protein-like MFS transporter [Halanaerobium sp. MA284_MarDTE_T2]RCW82511.1 FSR family fosmidomycin resistance protein-like MFS transporter [Halanaerobium sp. DL-01]